VVRTSLDQAGTKTGRFSSSSPNLQQLTKTDDSPFPVRGAFVPRPGYFFAMLDYEQQEFRLLLDYAGAFTRRRSLIDAVLGGLDVHQATADAAGVSRHEAKTVNFSVIYGVGLDLLAARLKKSRREAQGIKAALFEAAPEIQVFMTQAQNIAAKRGYIVTWHGRRWHCPDSRFAYRATNAVIQGGCADVGKVAMNEVERHLARRKSRLVMMVHDELILEVHESEPEVVEECRAIMQRVYPHKFLPLTVGADFSRRSLAEKTEWTGSVA
jgi:DNA polymerase-1